MDEKIDKGSEITEALSNASMDWSPLAEGFVKWGYSSQLDPLKSKIFHYI